MFFVNFCSSSLELKSVAGPHFSEILDLPVK